MTPGDSDNVNRPPDEPTLDNLAGVPFGHEDEAGEHAQPRRAASAEFLVESEVGSEALLREAMDPANQSLRDAMRLSYRVLQFVILLLVALFVVSGFKTVQEGETGVMLRWGKILGQPGEQALEPGPHFSTWPYPAGQFVIFRDADRLIDIGQTFLPAPRRGEETFEQMLDNASVRQLPRPGRDGLLLTAGGDIAHLRLAASFTIDQPVEYIKIIEDQRPEGSLDAETLVALMLRRAAVHVSAKSDLQTFVDFDEATKQEIMNVAQASLDQLNVGIRLVQIDTPIDPTPALAIKREYDQLQEYRVQVEQQVERARSEANSALVSVAGDRYPELAALLTEYERHLRAKNLEAANAELQRMYAWLEDEDKASGEVSTIIQRARAYRNSIETVLGNEARRFASLLPSYQKNPQLLLARLWSETYEVVMAREDVEIYLLPRGINLIQLAMASPRFIKEQRRDNSVQDAEFAARDADGASGPYLRTQEDIRLGGPGRMLDPEGQGKGQNR